jgi:hypothetical protein
MAATRGGPKRSSMRYAARGTANRSSIRPICLRLMARDSSRKRCAPGNSGSAYSSAMPGSDRARSADQLAQTQSGTDGPGRCLTKGVTMQIARRTGYDHLEQSTREASAQQGVAISAVDLCTQCAAQLRHRGKYRSDMADAAREFATILQTFHDRNMTRWPPLPCGTFIGFP